MEELWISTDFIKDTLTYHPKRTQRRYRTLNILTTFVNLQARPKHRVNTKGNQLILLPLRIWSVMLKSLPTT